MEPRSLGRVSTAAALALLVMWLTPPGLARALDSHVSDGGYAVVEVPATADAVQLWIDVEAPGIGASDVILGVDGAPVAMLDSPFGAGVVLPHDGGTVTVAVGLATAAEPDIAITLADAEGRILLEDSSRIPLQAVEGDLPPVPEPEPSTSTEPGTPSQSPSTSASSSPSGSTAPSVSSEPTVSTAPSVVPPESPPASPPPTRPGPGLPGSGVDAPAAIALVTAGLIVATAAFGLRKRGEQR